MHTNGAALRSLRVRLSVPAAAEAALSQHEHRKQVSKNEKIDSFSK